VSPARPGAALDRGGITAFRRSTAYQPPRQVSVSVRASSECRYRFNSVAESEYHSTGGFGVKAMKRNGLVIGFVLFAAIGLLTVHFWTRISVRQSGEGYGVGDHLIIAKFGYSEDGDRLRYAIFLTWPKGSTPEQRSLDPRIGQDFLGWPLIRNNDGRMIPVGTNGDVYFFEGDSLKTMRVGMNEHTDTVPLDNLKTLEEVWAYLQQYRVDH